MDKELPWAAWGPGIKNLISYIIRNQEDRRLEVVTTKPEDVAVIPPFQYNYVIFRDGTFGFGRLKIDPNHIGPIESVDIEFLALKEVKGFYHLLTNNGYCQEGSTNISVETLLYLGFVGDFNPSTHKIDRVGDLAVENLVCVPLEEKNDGRAKLNIDEAVKLYLGGMHYKDVATKLGTNPKYLSRVLRKHLKLNRL